VSISAKGHAKARSGTCRGDTSPGLNRGFRCSDNVGTRKSTHGVEIGNVDDKAPQVRLTRRGAAGNNLHHHAPDTVESLNNAVAGITDTLARRSCQAGDLVTRGVEVIRAPHDVINPEATDLPARTTER